MSPNSRLLRRITRARVIVVLLVICTTSLIWSARHIYIDGMTSPPIDQTQQDPEHRFQGVPPPDLPPPTLPPSMEQQGPVAVTVVLYTLEATWTPPPSPAFQRALQSGRLEIRYLPPDTTFPSSRAVSLFLTKPWLWSQLSSSPRILLFQTDSIICAAAPIEAESFFEYDFIGAPVPEGLGKGYNGGLSLRNPVLFREITEQEDFEADGDEFEDQWFFGKLQGRGARLSSEEVAKTFSVEAVWYERPLGFHQPQRWQAERLGEIEGWCPEVKMLGERRAF